MLARKYRLPGYRIPTVLRSPKKLSSALLSLRFVAQPKQRFSRFSIITSTKLSPQAVVRNRVKRQLYHQLQLVLTQIKPGYDLVIIPKTVLRQASFRSVRTSLKEILKQAKLYRYEKTNS
jgi:ribonuclease P protein component